MDYINIIRLKDKFNLLLKKKELRGATEVGDLLINEYRKSRLSNSSKYSDDIFDIACVYDALGLLKRAEELYLESVTVYKRLCGRDVGYTCRINNLAILYSKTDRKKDAIDLFKESYRWRFNILGYKSKTTGESLYNLGNAYYDLKDYERSLYYLKQSIKIWSIKSTDYIDNLNSIGYVYVAMGEYNKALDKLHEALNLTCEIEGIFSIEYIKNLYYIANLYYENGDYEIAKSYMELFVNIIPKVVGEKHPYILKALKHISDSLESMQDIEMALAYRLRIVELVKEIIGTNYIFYSDALSSAATILKNKGEYDKAEMFLKESLSIRQKLAGSYNLGYLRDIILLSGVYYEKHEYKKAIEEIIKIVDIIEYNKDNENLFDECLVEMIRVFLDPNVLELSEDEKQNIFNDIYNFVTTDELINTFNWHLFDDSN